MHIPFMLVHVPFYLRVPAAVALLQVGDALGDRTKATLSPEDKILGYRSFDTA